MSALSFRSLHTVNLHTRRSLQTAQILRSHNNKLSPTLLGGQRVLLKLLQRELSRVLVQKHVVFVHDSEWAFNLEVVKTGHKIQQGGAVRG